MTVHKHDRPDRKSEQAPEAKIDGMPAADARAGTDADGVSVEPDIGPLTPQASAAADRADEAPGHEAQIIVPATALTTATGEQDVIAEPAHTDDVDRRLFANSNWGVFETGIDSLVTAGPHDMPVPCFISKDALLRLRHGAGPGVSNWAPHVAEKSWCTAPVLDEFIEAFAHALRTLQPGQTVIDMAATIAEAWRVWGLRPPAPDASADAPILPPLKPTSDWLVAAPPLDAGTVWPLPLQPEYHEALQLHGMHPDDHPAARAFNRALAGLVHDGVTGEALESAALSLMDEHFFEREPEEEELPADFDWWVEVMQGG